MSAPRKFDEETRARAVRLYQDRLRDHGESRLAARRHVGALLDINPATLRNWIEAEERATRPGEWGDVYRVNGLLDIYGKNRGVWGVGKGGPPARRAGLQLGRDQVGR